MKLLFLRAVRTVAWNAVRGYECRCRAARLSVPERLPGRKWTCTSSPQSVGGPRAGETGGGAAVRGRSHPGLRPLANLRGSTWAGSCRQSFGHWPRLGCNAMSRMSPPHPGRQLMGDGLAYHDDDVPGPEARVTLAIPARRGEAGPSIGRPIPTTVAQLSKNQPRGVEPVFRSPKKLRHRDRIRQRAEERAVSL